MMRIQQRASLLIASCLLLLPLVLAGCATRNFRSQVESEPVLESAPQPEPANRPKTQTPPPLIDSPRLRRPAGAGGSGEGWAGIEGEPIPLDSTDPKYNDYLDRVRRMIKEKWRYPCVKNVATGKCEYKSARLIIVFGILKDGRVPVVAVARESGYEIYDEAAKNAILQAQPFPPVPASLMAVAKSDSSGVKIVAAFRYRMVDEGPLTCTVKGT